jgi:alkanesulfonate monooxygenase SsuD/methylene tetrahydromethanopterin reductase-like flavin-dependent oxidoreductase (luciferase family)
MWTGQQISHKGRFFDVNARLFDPPAKPIPLLMAGNGPKAMRRCGQHADGLVTDPKTWKQYKQEFENGAKSAGKNPNEMPVLVEQYVTVGDVNDAKKAAELWRFSPKAFKTGHGCADPRTMHPLCERADCDPGFAGMALIRLPGLEMIAGRQQVETGIFRRLTDGPACLEKRHWPFVSDSLS